MKNLLFSKEYENILKKAHLNYDIDKFSKLVLFASLIFSLLINSFFWLFFYKLKINFIYLIPVFLISFFLAFQGIKLIPILRMKNEKIKLESDLLYSTRHLLLKLESGSSLINSLDSVSKLNTKSGLYFKEIMFDISMGMPIEEAIDKAIQYSPSKAFTRTLEEISTSLKTGSDLVKTLKNTLDDITKKHLIEIQEYGKKLNPLSMFYMILGTVFPSLGTAMLVVATSLLPQTIIIDKRILFFLAFLVLVIQIFFVLSFRALKPAVIE